MPRVILLEPSSLDVSAAEEFGEIVYISRNRFSFDIDTIIIKTSDYLTKIEYVPLEDCICLTGHSQKLAIFVATVASLYSEFGLLMFDSQKTRYKKRIFRNVPSDS